MMSIDQVPAGHKRSIGKILSNNKVIAALLVAVTAILLTVTEPAIGITWDEPTYIAAANSNMSWFHVLFTNPKSAFKLSTIDHYWTVNHEHPPIDKIWSGMVWEASHHFLNDKTAHRLGNMLLVAGMVGVLYLLVARTYGKPAGLFSAAALMFMPRFFFHAHLAALDVPVAAGIFLVTCLFWFTVDRREWWWGPILGVAWGLAEGTKLNATFLPIALVVWALIFKRKWYLLLRGFLMGTVAVITFFATWPWMYVQLFTRIKAYYEFQVHHYNIGIWYLGHYYVHPPWHYVFVVLWAVVPLSIMVLALAGAVRARLGRQDKGLGWLLVISALVPMLVMAIGGTLAYDGERLFMPTFPFIAALAGVGFGWLLVGLRKWMRRISRPTLAAPAGAFLGIVLLLPSTITGVGLYPHLLSYYSEGVGGLRGATHLRMETTYWCESYLAAVPYINAHAKPGDLIWVEPWSYDVMIYYQLSGILRPDVKMVQPAQGAGSIFGFSAPQPVLGQYNEANWIIYQDRQTIYGEAYSSGFLKYLDRLKPPVLDVSYEGIPIMQLYDRKQLLR